MTKEQIESMIVDDRVIIICQDAREKLEVYNMIDRNLNIPLGMCAEQMVKSQEVNFEEHLAVGYARYQRYMTAWRTESPEVGDRDKISFYEFLDLIKNIEEDANEAEDGSIEDSFISLFV